MTRNTDSVQHLTIPEAAAGRRLDNFLTSEFKSVPKTLFYRLMRKGHIRVNKKRVKADYRVQAGDILRLPPIRLEQAGPVTYDERLVQTLLAQACYEDEDILVLNKPAGLAVHGGSGVRAGLIEQLQAAGHDKWQLAHRLDKETSGCLLIAKHYPALNALHRQLLAGEVDKDYVLLVKGVWPASRKVVDEPMAKRPVKGGERVMVCEDGKPAATHFSVRETYDEASLLSARLETGRTHQIRVHAAHMGHPILGDEKYGDFAWNRAMKKQGARGLFLHAEALSFSLPAGGPRITVTAPLPAAFRALLEGIE